MLTKEKLLASLMSVIAALGAWNLRATLDVADRLARIEERHIASTREDEQQSRDLIELRARVTACEIQLAELRRKIP